ncbi:protein saal1-like isoform X2 [Dreissena polymorpha]|uniref:protein saal1-like isoform X2 n=1 Tax=Dreissena polymorpha TaxID=45954 RepID=UPI0022653693|nr:protein saal1-like isoform X2 [Dreissena polymorpha]
MYFDMDSIESSPDRNPSPPPELANQAELLHAECIGDTAFSKHWLFTTLIKLIEEVKNEDATDTDLVVDIDDELQNELCKLWDMSMNSEVARFLDEYKALEILTGIIQKSKAPRVIEICIGVLGNMACEQEVCSKMAGDHKFIELVLSMMETRDAPTLVANTRLISTSLSNTGSRGPWIRAIQRSEEILDHLKFIFSSSTNCDLLQNTAELVDTLLDLETDLCVSWATVDFVESLLEATEQIGSSQGEAMELYLHIFQSFSTTESGVEALVAHIDALELKILAYLNEVCEYEIVGVDGKVQPLASALSVLNILFMTRPLGQMANLCNDEKLMRILLKILEPVYPMLQKYKEAQTNMQAPSDKHVASFDQSAATYVALNQSQGDIVSHDKTVTNGTKDSEDGGQSDRNGTQESSLSEEEKEELYQLTVLYDVLSAIIVDYCNIVFTKSVQAKALSKAAVSETHLERTPESNLTSKKGDVDSDSNQNKNNSSIGNDSGDTTNSNDSIHDSVPISTPVDTSVIDCGAILSYLDESCGRWRLNNLGLTLKASESGRKIFKQLSDLASEHRFERLGRILKDINEGRIINRADSSRDQPDKLLHV